ncbi:hypothetical protein ACFL4D_03220, partial [Candidatus Margulisiibacteriota bacterium]
EAADEDYEVTISLHNGDRFYMGGYGIENGRTDFSAVGEDVNNGARVTGFASGTQGSEVKLSEAFLTAIGREISSNDGDPLEKARDFLRSLSEKGLSTPLSGQKIGRCKEKTMPYYAFKPNTVSPKADYCSKLYQLKEESVTQSQESLVAQLSPDDETVSIQAAPTSLKVKAAKGVFNFLGNYYVPFVNWIYAGIAFAWESLIEKSLKQGRQINEALHLLNINRLNLENTVIQTVAKKRYPAYQHEAKLNKAFQDINDFFLTAEKNEGALLAANINPGTSKVETSIAAGIEVFQIENADQTKDRGIAVVRAELVNDNRVVYSDIKTGARVLPAADEVVVPLNYDGVLKKILDKMADSISSDYLPVLWLKDEKENKLTLGYATKKWKHILNKLGQNKAFNDQYLGELPGGGFLNGGLHQAARGQVPAYFVPNVSELGEKMDIDWKLHTLGRVAGSGYIDCFFYFPIKDESGRIIAVIGAVKDKAIPGSYEMKENKFGYKVPEVDPQYQKEVEALFRFAMLASQAMQKSRRQKTARYFLNRGQEAMVTAFKEKYQAQLRQGMPVKNIVYSMSDIRGYGRKATGRDEAIFKMLNKYFDGIGRVMHKNVYPAWIPQIVGDANDLCYGAIETCHGVTEGAESNSNVKCAFFDGIGTQLSLEFFNNKLPEQDRFLVGGGCDAGDAVLRTTEVKKRLFADGQPFDTAKILMDGEGGTFSLTRNAMILMGRELENNDAVEELVAIKRAEEHFNELVAKKWVVYAKEYDEDIGMNKWVFRVHEQQKQVIANILNKAEKQTQLTEKEGYFPLLDDYLQDFYEAVFPDPAGSPS